MIPRYRAWDREKDRMIYPSTTGVCFEMNDDGISVLDIDVDYPNDYGFPKIASILMQSTTLKDKNGVEIFEGDVVLADGVKKIVTFGEQEHEENFGDLIYYIGFNVYTKMGYSSVIPVEYEVIGNIWENSELLEGEQ